jgi:site-specific DNA recombinase
MIDVLASFRLSGPEQQSLLKRAQTLIERWGHLTDAERIEIYGLLLTKIILTRKGITLHYSRPGLLNQLLPQKNHTDAEGMLDYQHPISMGLKRCGVETKLIVEQPGHQQSLQPHSGSIRAIQKAVINALHWNEELRSGRAKKMRDIAESNDVGQRYVAQIIKLANLSPDLIRRILDGDIPHDLTLGKLKSQITLRWADQVEIFGGSV